MRVKSCLLVVGACLTLCAQSLAEDTQRRGRLPDGRAFRIDAHGVQVSDYVAELEQIRDTKGTVAWINTWLDKLWEGRLLFDESKVNRQSEESQEALQLLEMLIPELSELALQVKRVFGKDDFREIREDIVLVVAAFGRNAYARDNYVRGFMEFGRIFKDPDLVSLWRNQLDFVTAEIKQANEFMLVMKDDSGGSTNMFEHLQFVSRTLPGIFRAHTHDIRQLLCTYRCEFTYDRAAIEKHEARLWERKEIGPVEAGYWRAHGFNPDETAGWKKHEIVDPLMAAEWATTGFTPSIAVKWLQRKFSPG